jgi:hypothetical protein
LRGSFTRAITFCTPYFSLESWQMIRLSSSSPVQGRHDVGRPRDAGALEHEDLRRVADQHLVLELVLEPLEAVVPLLDQRHLVLPLGEQHAGEIGADLPSTSDEDVHQLGAGSLGRTSQARTESSRTSIATEVGQTVRRPRLR